MSLTDLSISYTHHLAACQVWLHFMIQDNLCVNLHIHIMSEYRRAFAMKSFNLWNNSFMDVDFHIIYIYDVPLYRQTSNLRSKPSENYLFTGNILRSQLANFSQFWSKFCHSWDQCKSGERRFSLYAGGSGMLFLTACPALIYNLLVSVLANFSLDQNDPYILKL